MTILERHNSYRRISREWVGCSQQTIIWCQLINCRGLMLWGCRTFRKTMVVASLRRCQPLMGTAERVHQVEFKLTKTKRKRWSTEIQLLRSFLRMQHKSCQTTLISSSSHSSPPSPQKMRATHLVARSLSSHRNRNRCWRIRRSQTWCRRGWYGVRATYLSRVAAATQTLLGKTWRKV